MKRFDRRAALWALLAILLLIALSSVFTDLKECGLASFSLVSVFLGAMIFVAFPWFLLVVALLAMLVGILWPRKPLYRTILKLLFAIAIVAVIIVPLIVVHSAGMPCEAI